MKPTLALTLCLTRDCQLNCDYCYTGPKTKKSMPLETALLAVDLGIHELLGIVREKPLLPKTLQLGFFGGEPLMEWNTLRKTTEYCEKQTEKHGIFFAPTLTTNALLLDAEKAEYLKEKNFHVGLSIDGDAESHDALRRFPNASGSHDIASKALQFFQNDDAEYAETIFVIDPRNLRGAAQGTKWLLEQGARKIALNPNFTTKWTPDDLDTWKTQYEKIAEIYIDYIRELIPVEINFIDNKIKTHVEEGYKDCDKCGFGVAEIAVAPSGNIYPCERIVADDSNTDLEIGNVSKGLNHTKINAISAERKKIPRKCQNCHLKTRCAHWCACVNYQTTGTLNEIDDTLCFHEKMTISIADNTAETLAKENNPLFIARFYG